MRRKSSFLIALAFLLMAIACFPNDAKAQTNWDASPMYRLYNPNSGEHFYTKSIDEQKDLIKKGWKGEGIGWYAPSSGEDVHRLYNPNSGDHHYTLSAEEKDSLVSKGWKYEGVGWKSDTAKGTPLYRAYNPNAKTGTHNYTTSAEEQKMLISKGWKDEAIGWYGIEINPEFISHRGNHKNAPENSLPAFQQVEYRLVETDVRLTADGKWIVMHDPTIDRMTNGSGLVSSLTYAHLQKVRIDTGRNVQAYTVEQLAVPTLENFLDICAKQGLIPVIEIKEETASASAYDDLYNMLNQYGFVSSQTQIISFNLEPLQEMRKRLPAPHIVYLTHDISDELIAQALTLGSNSGIGCVYTKLDAEKSQAVHKAGLSVGAWTVPASDFEKMKTYNVDFITTDD